MTGAADYLHCKKCGNVEYDIEQSYGRYVCDKCRGLEAVAKDRAKAEEYLERKRKENSAEQ